MRRILSDYFSTPRVVAAGQTCAIPFLPPAAEKRLSLSCRRVDGFHASGYATEFGSAGSRSVPSCCSGGGGLREGGRGTAWLPPLAEAEQLEGAPSSAASGGSRQSEATSGRFPLLEDKFPARRSEREARERPRSHPPTCYSAGEQDSSLNQLPCSDERKRENPVVFDEPHKDCQVSSSRGLMGQHRLDVPEFEELPDHRVGMAEVSAVKVLRPLMLLGSLVSPAVCHRITQCHLWWFYVECLETQAGAASRSKVANEHLPCVGVVCNTHTTLFMQEAPAPRRLIPLVVRGSS